MLRRRFSLETNPLRALVATILVLPVLLVLALAIDDREERRAEARRVAEERVAVLGEHADQVIRSNMLLIDQINFRLGRLSWSEIRQQEANIAPLLTP